MDLKLIAFRLLKLMTHVSAQKSKTTTAMRQSLLAARVVSAADPWASDDVWESFAASAGAVAEKKKAGLLQSKLKEWKRTKAGVMKTMTKAMKKRTVCTRRFADTRIFYTSKRKAMK